MLQSVKINTGSPYEVKIAENLIGTAGKEISKLNSSAKVMIISDDVVAPLYLPALKESLEKENLESFEFIFPHGEQSKNLDTLAEILESAAENKMTRSDIIVALGGGVTGDMAGFAAAVYMRGIRFIQVPTTLLAMVDSSVGGKTAVDLKAGKNLAGAFYQPSLVLCDCSALDTLSDDIFSQGMAEVIKYAVAFDESFFEIVRKKPQKKDMPFIIKRCVELKRDVVIEDEFDRGLRQLLNFGHTLGHANEKCSNYKLPHGEAVAIGMVMMSRGAYKSGLTGEDCTDKIIDALLNNSLPVKSDYSPDELFAAASLDKKRNGGTITVVVPEKIGRCRLETIDFKQLAELINYGY